MTILEHLAHGPIQDAPIDSIEAAFERVERAASAFGSTGERALAAGFAADRLGYAFLGGYEEALARLVAAKTAGPARTRASLCATEEGGAHPRSIRTRLERALDGHVVSGTKTFGTLANHVEKLYVVASEGERDGRNALRVVVVSADAPGVSRSDRPPTPFTPEIPHAKVTLSAVRVADGDVLPGDGYADYLKPFRTIEDVHVFLAVLGWLVRVSRLEGWPEASALVESARDFLPLADAPPSSPVTHLALAGAIDAVRTAADALPWERAHPETRSRWQRDTPILWIAEQARLKRTEAARGA